MAEVRIDVEFLRSRLLPGLDARIVDARFDGEHSVFLTLEGADVPKDCDQVIAIVTQRSESARLEPIPREPR